MLKVRKDRNARTSYNTRDFYGEYDNYYNSYDYDTIDLNDDYDYDTRYDVDFAYDDYGSYDEQSRYVEPVSEPRYSSFREYSKADGKIRSDKKKKRKMSNGVKALIVVYFAIVTVIASLLIINALPMMMTGDAGLSVEGIENVETVDIDANTIGNMVLADGTIVSLSAPETTPYEYTINTNWFDKMCDWMENIAA